MGQRESTAQALDILSAMAAECIQGIQVMQGTQATAVVAAVALVCAWHLEQEWALWGEALDAAEAQQRVRSTSRRALVAQRSGLSPGGMSERCGRRRKRRCGRRAPFL
ncbi:unnamed protein product [Effrenium voratum]|uniref:Uncharacterized protein n=1 Tax=Effrenium voratum TaxID=2562239 RepID=A0AA36MVU1_9DINO|nr:unnamed protein product [Effrenium voratum]